LNVIRERLETIVSTYNFLEFKPLDAPLFAGTDPAMSDTTSSDPSISPETRKAKELERAKKTTKSNFQFGGMSLVNALHKLIQEVTSYDNSRSIVNPDFFK